MKWMLRRQEEKEDDDVEGGGCSGGRPIPRPGTLCASLRSRNTHGHLRRAILCKNLREKCWTPIAGTSFRASLRSQNAHGHLRRATLWKFRRKNAGKHFVRACAVETHMDISGKMPHAPATLDQTPGFNPHRKNPFSVATLFGEKQQNR